MSQDVHRIIDLDIHVITDSRQLIFLGADDLVVLALNLPSRGPILGESTGDMDRLSVFLWFVRFFALILKVDGYLGDADMIAIRRKKSKRSWVELPLAFTDEGFETTSTAC